MKAVSGKRLSRILESKGWELKQVTGSHHIYVMSGNPARISVPVHKDVSLKIGLQKTIMKIAEIDESEL